MAHIFMTQDAKYVKIYERPQNWGTGFRFEVEYLEDINRASVFGDGGERWMGQHQADFLKLVCKLRRDCIQIKAELKMTRTVTLVKENK
ncbi:hypothetical protein VP501E541_P0278 [Vibrio phage 501E54-1]|nr:hypothetical protein VP501E541_P0278 [Vibrio phage 501E54-1]